MLKTDHFCPDLTMDPFTHRSHDRLCDVQAGRPFHWIELHFPNHPPLGKAVHRWSRENRIDFLLAHSMCVHPISMSDYVLHSIIEQYYYFPRVYPADLHEYMPGEALNGQQYKPHRYSTVFYDDWDGSLDWVTHVAPDFPLDNADYNAWTDKQRQAFFEVWGLGLDDTVPRNPIMDKVRLAHHEDEYGGMTPPHFIRQTYLDELHRDMNRKQDKEDPCKHQAMLVSRKCNKFADAIAISPLLPKYDLPPPNAEVDVLVKLSRRIGISYSTGSGLDLRL